MCLVICHELSSFVSLFFFHIVALSGVRKEFRIKTSAAEDQNQFRKKNKSIIARAEIKSILHSFGLEINWIKEKKLKKYILLLFES